MSVILPQIPARLRRVLGRFVGPAGAALFSLVLASCAGGGFGGAPDTPAVNPVSQPAPAASGPISPESQRNVAEVVSGLKLGDETPPISPENIAVSDDAEILNRNPFSSPSPAARASDWGARADSTRKMPGYKAFEIAVPSENPLMTVAVWISETPPDYPEGKPEQDPEAARKFLYLRLQVFIAVGHVALVEGGGVEVLESQVIVVEEKRPDPKPQPVTPEAVTLEAVTAETVCESGSLSANGQTQAQLDAGLISAAKANDLPGACEHLRRGANVDAREVNQRFRRTALMIAASDGRLELAKLLHGNGGDVRLQGGNHRGGRNDSPGWSALHYSAAAGHADVVSWLLDEGADMDGIWGNGNKSVMMEAAYWGRPDVIEILLSRGANVNALWGDGATPLHAALNPYGPNIGPHNIPSDFVMASYDVPNEDSFARAVSLLASHVSDVNARTYRGWTALDYAAYMSKTRLAEILRGYGGRCSTQTGPLCGVVEVATPDPVTLEAVTAETVCESGSLSADGQTQAQLDAGLLSAAEGNDLAGACEYLRRGANVDARESDYKRTALMIAANNGFLDFAKLLHANGVDVNLHGGSHDGGLYGRGWSALHYSAVAGNVEIARLLLDAGAEIESVWDGGGKTALWEASYWGRPGIVELLLSRGADVLGGIPGDLSGIRAAVRETTVNYPYTRTMLSYYYPKPSADSLLLVVSLLAAGGAELNERRRGGRSILDEAVNRNNARVAKVLRQFGGKCFVATGPLCGEVHVAVGFSSSGSGTVSAEGGGDALSDGDDVRQGATVMFTATPAAGHYVSGWSGNCAEIGDVADGLDGTAKFCAVSAASDLSVRAEFSEIPSLAGPLCASGSLSANGLTQAQLDAGLISAAEGNDLPGACEYLRRGADIETREVSQRFRRTALMIAAGEGFLELAKLLHGNGADVDRQAGNHRGGHNDSPGWTALHYAATAGHADMVSWLLDSGADMDARWGSGGIPGRSVLWEAAHWGRADVVELLLSRGADPEGGGSSLPLHGALWKLFGGGSAPWDFVMVGYSREEIDSDSYVAVVSLLASRVPDVNRRVNGKSALDVAAHENQSRLAAVLRGFGGKCFVQTGPLCEVVPVATPDPVTLEAVTAETVCESGSLSANGQTQAQLNAGLISAAKANNLTSACEYLRRGASPDSRESRGVFNRTALMIAASDGRLDLAKLLHGNGADVNQQKGQMNHWAYASPGWSALIYAATAGHADMVSWLLDSGADIEAYWHSPGKKTALWEAAHWGRADVIGILLSHGADPDRSDASDAFPLHGGAGKLWGGAATPSNVVMVGYSRMGEDEAVNVVSLLAAAVSDVNALENGKTALDLAASQNRPEVAAVLRNAGGKCVVETGPLCPVVEVVTAETVTVTAETVCESGSLSVNGQTQAQLNAGLISAAKANNLTSACEHLRRGASPDSRESRGVFNRTALMIAASDGRLDLAKLLHVNGADVNLQKGQMNRWAYASPGWSALIYAATAGHADMVSWLLDSGADIEAYWHSPGKKTALWEAAHWGRADVIDILLSHGADPDRSDASDAFPLHGGAGKLWGGAATPSNVVMVGYSRMGEDEAVNVVSLLAAAVSDVNALENGKTALDVAASQNRPEVAAVLRNAGGKCVVETGPLCPVVEVATAETVTVTAETVCESGSLSANGLTQAQLDAGLISAAKANNLANACEYLRRGASPDSRETRGYYRTALIVAADRNYPEMAGLLLSNGADADEGGARSWGDWAVRDWAALHYATSRGYAEVVRVLLEGGADADIRESRDRRPLFEAAFHGRLDIAELLLSHGAELDARDRWNTTALLGAVSMGSYGEYSPGTSPQAMVVSLLISRGANVNARTNVSGGESALDVAARHFRTTSRPHGGDAERYAEILRNHGGRCFVETGPLCGIPDVAVEYAVIPADESGGTVSATGDDGALSHEDEVRQGTTLTFTATPASGWMLSAWGGDAADCSGLVCALAADSDLSVHAEFSPILSLTDLLCPAGTLPTNGLTAAELNMTLRMAARGGDATRVCEALRRGAEVNDNLDDSEFTPLQEAVSGGHLEAAKVLLANGAEVNKRKDGAGHSPLDLAARDGEAEIAALLRNADGRCFVETGPLCQNVPVATPDPVTVVNTVAATVANTVVATVAATVAAVENTVASTVAAGSCPAGTLDANGMTQAQLDDGFLGAALENDVEEVCEYLRRGANIEIRTDQVGRPHHRSEESATALMIAGRNNYSDLARLLLSNGADVDSTGGLAGGGWSALHIAAYEDHADVARVLLDGGADPDVDVDFDHFSSWTPLHEAAYYNHWRIMKILLTSGANSNIQTTRPGRRGGAPLHYVFDGTRSDSALAVSVLVAGNADVNLRDSGGNSALDLAANRGDAASAEILRAAGGQCFVSTSSLCGSAPAPAAAAAESAPSADRLRESFAGAFNPSPAFGDAFGAASGSSERFLSRLDSLMRSASGSGGNAWDSFAGWQRENEHGRMWFSTGQRGDFGFGAGVGGAGGDLSASPFAAMVGNGMLAGGETGLGAESKLRIAAFADYQARSLLDGTDRQWTKWAASGTAIETAMTEAERFSGLAENQTRGAMTEIHLGGDELGVALQAGAVSESDAMLSGTADDENLRGLRARTAFAGLSGAANLFGSGWRLRGSAHLGRSWAESESMLRDGDLWASAFSAGLERGGWLYSDDGFILRFSQPLRVESLEMELIGEGGASRLGADPSGRQLDVDAAYRLPLSGGGWLLLSAGVRRDGGHTSSSDLEAGALFSVERGF